MDAFLSQVGVSNSLLHVASIQVQPHLSVLMIILLHMQKPVDLDGCCPFLSAEKSCPYGITCRFSNTHKKSSLPENKFRANRSHETNTLNKDLQKLLWKNKVKFPKADGQLKLLGLRVCGS